MPLQAISHLGTMRYLLPVTLCYLALCLSFTSTQNPDSTASTMAPVTDTTGSSSFSSSVDTSTGSSVSADSSTGSSVSADTSTGSSVSADTSTGSSVSADTSTGSSVSADTSTGSSVSMDTSTGSSVSADISTGSSVSMDTSTGSSVSMDTSTGSSVSMDTSTGSSVSMDTSTGSSVSMDTSTGSSVSMDTSTGSSVSMDTSTGSSVSMDTSTGSSVSMDTSTGSSVATGNETSANYSSTNESPTTALATTPMTMTTTPAPTADLKHNVDTAFYTLKLRVRPNNTNDINNTDIRYQPDNMTRQGLLDALSPPFTKIGAVVTLQNDANSMNPNNYILAVTFFYKQPNNTETLKAALLTALQEVNDTNTFDLPNESAIRGEIQKFAFMTADICMAENACPPGFTCNLQGCLHMCTATPNFCNGHGMCYVTINSSANANLLCQCDSEYETEYTGDKCESSRRGRLQIIAIIAGVLGAACLVFIIIIIILCVLRNRGGSGSKYTLADRAYTNNAYDNDYKN